MGGLNYVCPAIKGNVEKNESSIQSLFIITLGNRAFVYQKKTLNFQASPKSNLGFFFGKKSEKVYSIYKVYIIGRRLKESSLQNSFQVFVAEVI